MRSFVKKIFFYYAFISSLNGISQSLLIDPAAEGGFELVGGIAGNGWTVVNSTINQWQSSGVAIPYSGTNSAFISNNGGINYGYDLNTFQTSHFYRDVTVPAGNTSINLKFQYKSISEPFFDRLLVYVASTTVVPVADLPASSTSTLAGATLIYEDTANVANYQQVNLFLPSSLAGTTFRLIFTWQNDDSVGDSFAPASVDDIFLYSASPAALNGIYTINNAVVTSTNLPVSGGNFNSFTDAVNYLNINGISGPVTFNVAAGQTFSENPQILTASGTAAFPIIFQKSGSGTNPLFIGKNGIGALDACFSIKGSDYITFDGIDVETFSGSVGGNLKMEFGYYLLNNSATNGTKKITIKNCKISLDRANNCMGIYQNVATVPTSKFGTNSANTFDNVTIENSFQGIYLSGNATYLDDSIQIKNCFIGGNTPFDIGGGNTSNACAGVWVINQKNCKIFNNTIKNVATINKADGIFVNGGYGICEVYNNKITAIRNNGTASTTFANGIRADVPAAAAGAQTIRVYNNFISDITSAYSGANTSIRIVKGIFLQSAGAGNTASVIEVTHNSVNIDCSNSPNCSSSCFEVFTTSGPIYKVRNNIFANNTAAQTPTLAAKHYCWRSTSAASIGNAGSVSDNNDLYIANATNGFVGNGGVSAGTDFNFASWKTNYNQDNNSISVDPLFNSTTDLHVLNPALNSAAASASLTAYITTDIDGQTRTQPSDIGADEFTPLNFDLKSIAIINPLTTGCYTSAQPVSASIKNNTGFPLDFSVNPANVIVQVSGAASQTISLAINTGTLNAFTTTTVAIGNINMSAYGTYSLNCYTSLVQDQNNSNDTIYNITRVNLAPASLPQVVDFTNFTGVNLNTLFPGWSVASGSVPTGTASSWVTGNLANTNARVSMNTAIKKEWIVSPKIIASSNTLISYKAAVTFFGNNTAGTMGADDNLHLMISTDCGNSFQILTTLNSTSGLTNSFSQFFYPLNSYAGQEIILAFHAIEGATANNYDLHLEDINISNVPVYDLSVNSLVEPQQKNCYTGAEQFVVTLKNEGPTTLNFATENVTLVGKLNGTNSYSLNINSGTINSGASQNYTLATNINMQPVGIYNFTSYAILSSSDANNTNDTLKKLIFTQNPSVAFSSPNLVICKNDSALINSLVTINGLAIDTIAPIKNTDGAFAILDNNLTGITSNIQVSGVGGFASQLVEVRIDSLLHTYVGDLVISLIAPDNSIIQLSANNGANGDNYLGTIFKNNSLNAIGNGIAPFTGTFNPAQSFDLLTGLASGTWKLNVKDISLNEVGTFYRWSLVFKSSNTLSTFTWNPSSDLSSSNSLNPKASPSSNSQYTLTITDFNGCEASAVQSISVNAIPVISLGNDTAICQGNSLVLDAGVGFNSYSWNGGIASTQQYNVNQQGNYSVVVTNSNNCSVSDTVVLVVNQNPIITLISSADSLCSNGQAITFTASPAGGTYSGNGINQFGVFNPQSVSTGSTLIYYEFTNANGCFGKDSSLVEVLPKPIVSFVLGTPTLCINSGTTALTNGLPFGGIYLGNGVSGNVFDPAISGSGNQIITYSYTDQYGCSDSAKDSVLVDLCTGLMSIQNNSIKVYPNPVLDVLNIDNLAENAVISIFDVAGKQIVYTINKQLNTSLSLSNLSAGIYFVKIQNMENELLVFKILKN